MAYWLADKRTIQETDTIQRFDPRFWTVDFPRPMMASLVTIAPDALRVDAVFHHKNALAGLIWESEDRWSHPLLAYDTRRDYRGCTLNFHWRSSAIRPLDAVNGPTLTIEGRDEAGQARTWYVRLWNYASGTAQDAAISLPFGQIDGGFLLPGEADRVYAGDIDRLFISLVPTHYDGTDTLLDPPTDSWVELTNIHCSGGDTGLLVGDIHLPEHDLRMATAYDDAYNQTPERLLRQVRALGYRSVINHYVGMSHYFKLMAVGETLLADPSNAVLNEPCRAWHQDFANRAKAMGFELIFSLSYEMFDAHCPENWKQRAANGDPALTGWVPPSTLLSPAHQGAMAYLQSVGAAFALLLANAGLPVRFQIGEPWWWITPDGRPCLYDAAIGAALGPLSVTIADMRVPPSAAQGAMLDQAGIILGNSTAALAAAVRNSAPAESEVELLLLVYLPTVLNDAMPGVRRANLPPSWHSPAFDTLQLEDYDWATAGLHGLSRKASAQMASQLGYPIDQQHYFSGFVLSADDAGAWADIEQAALVARAAGVRECFIWALPQVVRDGFTFFDLERQGKADMQSYHDTPFPLAIGRHAVAMPEFSTGIVTTLSGHERRNTDWADARMRYDVAPGVRSENDVAGLLEFFRARRGAAIAFPFCDPFDFSSAAMNGPPGALDQVIGTGDGQSCRFLLSKTYGGEGGDGQQRPISRPVPATVRIAISGVETIQWSLQAGGMIEFSDPPPTGSIITAGYFFDVPVRFADDRLNITRFSHGAAEVDSVWLVEVKELI